MKIILKYIEEDVRLIKHEFELEKNFLENGNENGLFWDEILHAAFFYLYLGADKMHREDLKEVYMRAEDTKKVTDDECIITFEDEDTLQSISDLIVTRMQLEPIKN